MSDLHYLKIQNAGMQENGNKIRYISLCDLPLVEKYGHLANHLPNVHVDRQKNDHLPTHKQHLITTKKLGNKKVIDFALANELFWETNTLGYSYVNSLCGQGLDNVPLSHGQTWTIG